MDYDKYISGQTLTTEDFLFDEDIAGVEAPVDPKLIEQGIELKKPERLCEFEINDPLPRDKSLEVVKDTLEHVEEIFNSKIELLPSKKVTKEQTQQYVLLSYVGPGQDQKSQDGSLGMKIWGMFDTMSDLTNHLEFLYTTNPEFKQITFFASELFRWGLTHPDIEKDATRTSEEKDKIISDIVKFYMTMKIKNRELFNLRKDLLIGGRKTMDKLPEQVANDYIPQGFENGPENKENTKTITEPTKEVTSASKDTILMDNENYTEAISDSETPRIKDQNLAVFSIAFPFRKECTKNESMAIKFWGAYSTGEDAQLACDIINDRIETQYYETVIVNMYEWVKLPIDIYELSDSFVKTTNKNIQNLMSEYKSEVNKSDRIFDDRKLRVVDPTEKIKSLKEKALLDSSVTQNNEIAREMVMPSLPLPPLQSIPVPDDQQENWNDDKRIKY